MKHVLDSLKNNDVQAQHEMKCLISLFSDSFMKYHPLYINITHISGVKNAVRNLYHSSTKAAIPKYLGLSRGIKSICWHVRRSLLSLGINMYP